MSKAHTIALIGALLASQPALSPAAYAESRNGAISDLPHSQPLHQEERGVKSEELARQAEIYGSRGSDVPSGYTVDRSLLAYAYALSAEFPRSLGSLDATDRWLDIGAGEGRAILDYCAGRYEALYAPRERRAKKARAVAMSIEDRRTQRWHQAACRRFFNFAPHVTGWCTIPVFIGNRLGTG